MPHVHNVNATAGFFELWSPLWIVIIALLIVGYIKLTGKAAKEPVTFKQKFFFVTGLLVIYVAEGTPLSYYGHHYVFSFHMLQMALLYLIAPPLLLLGTPGWFIKPYISKPRVKKVIWFMTNPLLAILLFNGLFSFYHIPGIMDTVMTNGLFQFAYHIVLFASAVLMYWLIVCPVPEFNRISPLMKLAYIFGNGVLLTPACALIIFSDIVLYDTYAQAPRVFNGFPALEDQQLGGTLMKIIQEIVYGTALGAVFYSWARQEKLKDKEELAAMKNNNQANMSPKLD